MADNTDSHTPKRNSNGCVRFTPAPSQGDAISALKKIPRYLFRVHTPSTSGETSLESVVSRAALCGHCRADNDIFSMPPGEAAEMLNCHLRGWARDGDNLMSWTSSLLFALQYALYRSILPKGGPYNDRFDIWIYVLDTRLLPEGSFIPDVALLDAFTGEDSGRTYNLSNMRRLRRETSYNFGEYLCQGKLLIEGASSSASLGSIIYHGLFRLCPELGVPNKNFELAKRVCRLRIECFASPTPTTKADFRFASTIAQGCFGEEDQWALPMTAAFLSLRKRLINDVVIVGGFKALFSDQEICKHDLDTLKTYQLDTHPETHQFSKIAQDIHSDYLTRVLDSVLATATKLSREYSGASFQRGSVWLTHPSGIFLTLIFSSGLRGPSTMYVESTQSQGFWKKDLLTLAFLFT
ncbi:hypothetical protein BDP55DRAFT_638909 [Colletotrichum godetiae]|uniref:DUF7587 domain-containing protein n=1 Tax=Colletotrichum godetiae TaxID=1209918 RepID=A0AAJ0EL89_9PEZI|nr:uncharacterized protein BDP55DRAFT_638909 [Colletotrichum godetiae]KAK1657270.1 hypothetical protein BDP55DRAFT_638909 [Colletotrichum godetiae]